MDNQQKSPEEVFNDLYNEQLSNIQRDLRIRMKEWSRSLLSVPLRQDHVYQILDEALKSAHEEWNDDGQALLRRL